MKYDTSGIDTVALVQHLNTVYGLALTTLSFLPIGEEAGTFAYRADGERGDRYFVRAQRTTHDDLERTFVVTDALHSGCGVDEVVAPYRTHAHAFTSRFGEYAIALFPFFEGVTAHDVGMTDEQLAAAAAIIARLHTSGERCTLPPMLSETFANPFARPIRRALHAAQSSARWTSGYQQRTADLLRREQGDVAAVLTRMHHLGREARRLAPSLVPTHGDPNLANFIIDPRGGLHLTDWGEVALGPRERDLTFFTGDRFGAFLRRYLWSTGPVRLHRSLIAFYQYRWVAQEIADYTARIFSTSSEPQEVEHAWQELQPYLPVPTAAIQHDNAAILRVLRALATDKHLEVVD